MIEEKVDIDCNVGDMILSNGLVAGRFCSSRNMTFSVSIRVGSGDIDDGKYDYLEMTDSELCDRALRIRRDILVLIERHSKFIDLNLLRLDLP